MRELTQLSQSMTKSLQESDYNYLNGEPKQLEEMVTALAQYGCRIDIGHKHRFWEYGRAIAGLISLHQERLADTSVLDVGSGWSPLGPTLAFRYGVKVTECEPDPVAYKDRELVAKFLAKRVKNYSYHQLGIEKLPNEKYDAVMCVSVLEHVDEHLELRAWDELARRVKPNGMLYITVDCVPELGRMYMFDNLRQTNYTIEMLKDRIDRLQSQGFVSMGRPDYIYHGSEVYNYTFFGIGMINANGRR